MSRTPLAVDLVSQQDVDVFVLASIGMTVAHIADRTGLSKSQVSYRLRQFKLSTMTYRRGGSGLEEDMYRLASNAATVKEDIKDRREDIISRRKKKLV